jgi:hypothetical protein
MCRWRAGCFPLLSGIAHGVSRAALSTVPGWFGGEKGVLTLQLMLDSILLARNDVIYVELFSSKAEDGSGYDSARSEW